MNNEAFKSHMCFLLVAIYLDFNSSRYTLNSLNFFLVRVQFFARMSATWFKNFTGIRQSEFEMLQVPNPGAEFGIHVTIRSIQTGALIGSLLGPLGVLLGQRGSKSKQSYMWVAQ